MNAIYNKELKQFFLTPMGYIFIAFIILVIGIYTTAINLVSVYPNFEYTMFNSTMLYLLLIPVLTMRSLAEEKRQRTEQLLFSSPVSITGIVVGKFLAIFTMILIPLMLTCFIPILLQKFGEVSFAAAYNSIAVFALLGAALVAIGMFISSFTDNQIVAAVVTLVTMFMLYFMPNLLNLMTTTSLMSVIAFIVIALLFSFVVYGMTRNFTVSLITAFVIIAALVLVYTTNSTVFEGAITNILRVFGVFDYMKQSYYGIIDINVYVYYLSVTSLFLFFTVQSIEQRRWN